MTWTRLGDNFYDRPDLGRVSRSARLLFVEMLVYCNRELLDGAFPAYMLRRVCDDPDALDLLAELETAGVVTAEGDDVLRVDWTDQEDGDVVRGRRERDAARQKRYRLRQELHRSGDHSQCDARHCKGVTSNVTRNDPSHVTGVVTPSLPDPTRPVPKGQGTGTGVQPASADAPPADAVDEAVARWGRPAHPYTGECCALPDQHPLHAHQAEAS